MKQQQIVHYSDSFDNQHNYYSSAGLATVPWTKQEQYIT